MSFVTPNLTYLPLCLDNACYALQLHALNKVNCNILQLQATYYNYLQHINITCNTLQLPAIYYSILGYFDRLFWDRLCPFTFSKSINNRCCFPKHSVSVSVIIQLVFQQMTFRVFTFHRYVRVAVWNVYFKVFLHKTLFY